MRHSQTSPSLTYDNNQRTTPVSKPYLENNNRTTTAAAHNKKPLSPFRKRSQQDSSFNERTSDEQQPYKQAQYHQEEKLS